MWELDHKEGWELKNWCFWIVVLEKTLESPLDSKEIQPVHSKGDQSWVFFGRTDAKAETPVLWPPHAKCWLAGKGFDAGRDWGQEKGMTEDEMAGWHHRLNGHEFVWTPGVGDGQGLMGSERVRHDWVTEVNWTEPKACLPYTLKIHHIYYLVLWLLMTRSQVWKFDLQTCMGSRRTHCEMLTYISLLPINVYLRVLLL